MQQLPKRRIDSILKSKCFLTIKVHLEEENDAEAFLEHGRDECRANGCGNETSEMSITLAYRD